MFWATKVLGMIVSAVAIGHLVSGQVDRGLLIMALAMLLSVEAEVAQTRRKR